VVADAADLERRGAPVIVPRDGAVAGFRLTRAERRAGSCASTRNSECEATRAGQGTVSRRTFKA